MKIVGMLAVATLMLSLLLVAAPASAVTCADLPTGIACSTELGALCSDTEAAVLSQRDKDTLVSKVVGAGIKIEQGKIADADAKLNDYESKLTSLINASKPKISADDATILTTDLIAAQMCVGGL